MKLKKSSIGLAALAIGTLVSFVGALSSTLAWFAYTTNVDVQMKGTTINETEQLQVGLKTNIVFSDALIEEYKLTTIMEGEDRYVFAAPGAGFNSNLISYYLSYAGYASNTLVPVTSKKYDAGDDLDLKYAPQAGHPEFEKNALKNQYSKIPFAFRVVRTDRTGASIYAKKQNLWVSNAKAIADGGVNNIYKAVRVFFSGHKLDGENIVDNKFIFNPSASNTAQRYTNVAGLLNLNDNDYYDLYPGSYGVGGTEIIYGDYEGTATPTALADDTGYDDINGTGITNRTTTFTAKHRGGNNCYTSLDGITPHKANFKTLSDIKPVSDATGFLSGGEVVAVTSDTENAIADLEATVYIEGWDHSVINEESEHKFFLGMTFEINRVA